MHSQPKIVTGDPEEVAIWIVRLCTADMALAQPIRIGAPFEDDTRRSCGRRDILRIETLGRTDRDQHADWPVIAPDGDTATVDARLCVETDDGAILLPVTYTGRLLRGHRPIAYVAPVFQTAHPAYHWLNSILAVGRGEFGATLTSLTTSSSSCGKSPLLPRSRSTRVTTKQQSKPGSGRVPGFAICAPGRLAGHPGVVNDRSADLLLPRLRESSRCLPVARSAATGSTPRCRSPGPAVTGRRRPGCCYRDEWPWRVRRPSAPRSQMTKRKARVRVTTALWPGRSGAAEGVGAGRLPAAVQIGDGGRRGPCFGL